MPTAGRTRSAILLTLAMCGLTTPVRAGADPPDERHDDVRVLLVELVVFRGVRGQQVEQMRAEISKLWAAQGVTIAWTSVPTPASVRVVIDRPTDPLPAAALDGTWAVAHARVVRGHVVPPIYASVEAAERVVRAAAAQSAGRGQHGPLLARVLARAIAHQLAHLLLDTGVHTESGMLRARFSGDEFVAPTSEGFGLDDGQRATLRAHRLLLTARVESDMVSAVAVAGAVAAPAHVVTTGVLAESRPCSFLAASRWAVRAAQQVDSAAFVEQ